MRRASGSLLLAGALAVGACAKPAVVTPPPPPPTSRIGAEQTGLASWYGEPHHGRLTASGEVFNMNALTAAHRTLPLGTRLLVTDLESGKSVEVRVNDRGPFVGDRILDLSYAAARALGGVGRGVIRVRLRVLEVPAGSRPGPTGAWPGMETA